MKRATLTARQPFPRSYPVTASQYSNRSESRVRNPHWGREYIVKYIVRIDARELYPGVKAHADGETGLRGDRGAARQHRAARDGARRAARGRSAGPGGRPGGGRRGVGVRRDSYRIRGRRRRKPRGGRHLQGGRGAGRISEGVRGRALRRTGDGEPRGLDGRGPGAGPRAPGGQRGAGRLPGSGDDGGRKNWGDARWRLRLYGQERL